MSEKSNQTIEQKMNTLREMAAWFESDDFSLNQAAEKFKEAALLARDIETELHTLKNDIDVLKKSFEEA